MSKKTLDWCNQKREKTFKYDFATFESYNAYHTSEDRSSRQHKIHYFYLKQIIMNYRILNHVLIFNLNHKSYKSRKWQLVMILIERKMFERMFNSRSRRKKNKFDWHLCIYYLINCATKNRHAKNNMTTTITTMITLTTTTWENTRTTRVNNRN